MKTAHIRNGLSALAALAAIGAVGTQAVAQGSDTIANLSLNQTHGTVFTFNSTTRQLSAKSLTGNPGIQVLESSGPYGGNNLPAYFAFGPISETGPVVSGMAAFSNGTFSIIGADKTTLLLSGTFGDSQLTVGGMAGTLLSFDDVRYTGGSIQDAFLAAYPGTGAIGDFALSFSGITNSAGHGIPGGLNAASFPSFTAKGLGGTFDATAVPEPTSLATFAFTALGAGGLLLRARKGRPAGA